MVDLLTLVLDWLHILSVVIWIGGGFFMLLILMPSFKVVSPPEAGKLMEAVGKRWLPLVWGAVILVSATGILRAGSLDVLSFNILMETTYGNIILTKMIMVVAMIVLVLVQMRVLIKLKAASPENKKRLQKYQGVLAIVMITIGLVIILLAVM
jgi:uncharacterized membrane protein